MKQTCALLHQAFYNILSLLRGQGEPGNAQGEPQSMDVQNCPSTGLSGRCVKEREKQKLCVISAPFARMGDREMSAVLPYKGDQQTMIQPGGGYG